MVDDVKYQLPDSREKGAPLVLTSAQRRAILLKEPVTEVLHAVTYRGAMKISYLANHPGYVSDVASWIFLEWDHLVPGTMLERVEEKFRGHLNRDSLPLTLIALEGDLLVGTASLLIQDLPTRADLSPWLACVYVQPAQRNKGIGTRVVQAVEDVAKRLRVEKLYLFTPDKERFYARLGWHVMDGSVYRDQAVVIMAKSITGGWPG